MEADAERPGKEPVMPRAAISRAALLLVLVLLTVPALQAEPNRAEAGPAGLFTEIWNFLNGVWSTGGCEVDPDGLNGVWSTNGCELDPSGIRCPRPTTVEADNGCELDPSGRCRNKS